jgi:hypothetical protein
MRRFGWIIPAYTMPANAEHVAVLRVVIREDFSRSLAERCVPNFEFFTVISFFYPSLSCNKKKVQFGTKHKYKVKTIWQNSCATNENLSNKVTKYWRHDTSQNVKTVKHRLITDLRKVMEELEAHATRRTLIGHVELAEDGMKLEKSMREITGYWRKLVSERKKTAGVAGVC